MRARIRNNAGLAETEEVGETVVTRRVPPAITAEVARPNRPTA